MAGRYSDDGQVGRKHPSSGVHIRLGEPNIVFVTIVTRDRKRWLVQPIVHQLLRESWLEARAWLVGYYLLMPDHLHFFCAPRDLEFTLDEWITYWKRQFKLNAHHGRVRVPSNPDQTIARLAGPEIGVRPESHPPLMGDPSEYGWQEGKPWDTRLRRSENYQEKWHYLRENPVRKGLVQDSTDWPYQGTLNVLPW